MDVRFFAFLDSLPDYQGFSLSPLAMPDLCDVNGDGICDPNDFFVLISRLSGGTEDLQVCPATLAGNVPSSAGLDLSVSFDGLGRLTSQTGQLAGEPVSRSYSYDGLSRLKTAAGPWEKRRGSENAVTWTYGYDALGNLRTQVSSRALAENGDHRTWTYAHPSKPHFLTELEQVGADSEEIGATTGGEAAWVDPGLGYNAERLVWNALGKLHQYKDSAYSYDAFGERTLVVTGPSGSTASIVSVGEDFEYDIGASRANKHFSLSGVRIASLATSYVAESASVPPSLRIALRVAQPLAAPAAASLLVLGMLSLASLALRRRTPVWLAAPGVGVLSFALVALPYTAQAATLTVGAGRYGRHAESILAYLVDHLGTVRAAVNRDGIVVETRDYAPFGESISHVGAFSVQHRFTGQPQDDQEGGLYDYGARFYNPKWGRFVSPDEVVQGFDSQGLNPFAYVLNRPTSATDPTGQYIYNGFVVPSTWRVEAADAASAEYAIARDSKVYGTAQSGSNAGGGIGSQATGGQVSSSSAQGGPGSVGNAAPNSIMSSVISKIASVMTSAGRVASDFVGKIWALPVTVLGLAVGLFGLPFGAKMQFRNNAIQFVDFPVGSPGEGLTLGNVQIYPRGSDPATTFLYYYGSSVPINLGLHEEAHTYQAQTLGVFFLPAYFLSGGINGRNRFEQSANRYALGGEFMPW